MTFHLARSAAPHPGLFVGPAPRAPHAPAARWDGLIGRRRPERAATGPYPAADVDWVHGAIAEGRDGPFEIVVDGVTPAEDRAAAAAIVRAHEDAGATWWIEADWSDASTDALRRRIEAGPPR